MFPDLASTRDLGSVLDVLGAMITPAVLILASSSLLITTSSRSIRCIDRVRERAEELEALGKGQDEGTERRRTHLFTQLEINTRRARLLQKAMSRLYIGISFFIATSVAIGVVSLIHVDIGWIPLLLGFIGAGLLFSASIFLIFESRLALTTTYAEMDYIDRNYMHLRSWSELLLFALAGFLAQMIDGMLSMGYGVSATTLLLAFGVAPAGASASVHTAEVVTTAFSAWSHWRNGNVIASFVKKLLIPGVLGAIAGAYLLTTVPGEVIKPFIAAYLAVMGAVILYKAFRPRREAESHAHLVPLGLAGGFCDSIGGGGWGPIVAGTLVARGNPPRTTIGSVAFAEFFVTFAASATLLLTIGVTNWKPIAGLALGGAIASPIAARLTGRIAAKPLMIFVGVLVILLSARTIWQALFGVR